MIGVVPLNPTIYGAASNAEVGGDLDDAPSTNICPNGATSSPLAEVVLELGFEDKLVKLFELRGAATRAPNGCPVLVRATIRSRWSSRDPPSSVDLRPRDPV
jgi:hypothetical protein